MVEYPHGQVRAVTHHGIDRRRTSRPTLGGRRPHVAARESAAAPAGTGTDGRRPEPARPGRSTVTDRTRRTSPSPARSPPPTAARSTSASTTWSRRASGGSSATIPDFATYIGIHTEDDRLGDGERDAVARRDRRGAGPPRRGRGDRAGRPVAAGRLRARPRDPQPPARRSSTPRSIRTWERRSTALDGVGDAAVRAVRPGLRAAARAARRDRRPARGDPGLPRRHRSRGRSSPRSGCGRRSRSRRPASCPSFFDEIVAAGAGVLGRPSCAASRGRGRRRQGRASADYRGVARGHARRAATDEWALGRERYDELVAPARVRRPRRRRRSSQIGEEQLAPEQGGPRRGRPRDRPERRRGDRRRPDQARPPGDVRGGARGLSRRHGPGPPATSSSTDIVTVPPTSGSRSSRRPSTSATSSRSRPTSSRRSSTANPNGHLHRHAVGRRRPGRDARAQLQLDQQHEHPRGVPRPPPPAGGRRRSTRA